MSSPAAASATPPTFAKSLTPNANSNSAAGRSCCSRCFRLRGWPAQSVCRSRRSSRTWRSATTSCTASGTGCAIPRSTPPVGSGITPRRQICGSTPTTRCTTTTPTSSARTMTSATASCAWTRTSAGSRCIWFSRCPTPSTPASSSTGSPPTTSRSASSSRAASTRPTFVPAVKRCWPRSAATPPATTCCIRCCLGPQR